MNIIDERDVRTIHRKLQKKKYDEILTLSVSDGGQSVRLLDEGTVVSASGSPLFYLTKGTLERYLEVLPDDYEGSINLGHMDFATFPILLGKWTKDDFTLVDIGDGRKGLNVNLRLDEDNFLVKELRRASYDLGVSAEFGYHVNEELSEKMGLEIIDEIFISDFAIVGEAGNVNSSGIRLKGGPMKTIKELSEALEKEGTSTIEGLDKKLAELLDDEKVEEVVEEEKAEEVAEEVAEEPAEEAEEAAEETAEEPAEEEKAEEKVEEEKSELSAIAEQIDAMRKELSDLKAENEELKSKLSVKDKAEKEFVERFKTLAVSLSTERVAETVETEDVFTDGIGE